MSIDSHPAFSKIAPGTICAEIGTWEGASSYKILKYSGCKKLYCIDPYTRFDSKEYPDGINELTQSQFNQKFEDIKRRLAEFGDRVEFLRMKSSEAVKMFGDGSLDFVYIDGNHDYKYVFEDIMMWYPKVKAGGYVTGDDVWSTNLSEHDADGNVTRIWGPGCWGKYGTYKALLDSGYTFTVKSQQFVILK